MRRIFILGLLVLGMLTFPEAAVAQTADILEKAKVANDDQDYSKAFNLAMEAYDQGEDSASLWLQMGIALQGMGKDSDALTCLQKVVEKAGNQKTILAEAYLHLGEIYGAKGDAREAVAALDKAINLDKDNWKPYAERARIKFPSDRNAAEKDLKAAEKLAPNNAQLYVKEAWIYLEASLPDEALKAINKAISLDDSDAFALFTRATVMDAKGDVKAAAQDYIKSLELDDFDSPLPFLGLLRIEDEKGRSEVIEEMKRQTAVDPRLYGPLFVLLDNWDLEDEATEVYDELVKRNNSKANHYFRVAKMIADSYENESSPREASISQEKQPAERTANESAGDEDPDRIFKVVEEVAEFPGGQNGLMQWLSSNIRYPDDAQLDHAEGRSVIRFVVEKDGSISNVDVLKRCDPSLDAEALRVVRSMPAWLPAKNGGKPVRSYFVLPVTFRLNV